MKKYKHSEITEIIIRAFYNVYNRMGHGFLEKVYENCMLVELRKLGLEGVGQLPVDVFYEEYIVGKYYADILVEGCVILELKSAEKVIPKHEAQLLNYLKATELEVGLILNFGLKPQVVRKAFENYRK